LLGTFDYLIETNAKEGLGRFDIEADFPVGGAELYVEQTQPGEALMSARAPEGAETHKVRIIIETIEKADMVHVYIYPELKFDQVRYAEACRLVNFINCRCPLGSHIAFVDKGTGIFRWNAMMNFEKADISTNQIHNCVYAGLASNGLWWSALLDIGATERSAEEIEAEFEQSLAA
jgi:hypothetical protein